MNRLSGLDAKRVLHTLSSNLEKERNHWKPHTNNNGKVTDKQQRDEFAVWISKLSDDFEFLPETCGLGILLMDKVHQVFKVQAKYMQCVAVTCLYIAAKTLEEDENLPSTPEFVKKSCCGCSFAEITRMEIVILNKLNWNIKQPSAIDFLHSLHVVLLLHYPTVLVGQGTVRPSHQLTSMTSALRTCLTHHTTLEFRPSTVALAALSLELETITPGWLRLVTALQRITNVGSEQLMACRETLGAILGHTPSLGYTARNRHSSSGAPPTKKPKVKHEAMSDEENDEVYESIRLLYREEPVVAAGKSSLVRSASCSLAVHQDSGESSSTAGRFGHQTLLVN